MKLILNGQPVEEIENMNVRALLGMRGIDTEQKGVAVALNGSVVPRSRWDEQELRDGDRIEIITAMQGG